MKEASQLEGGGKGMDLQVRTKQFARRVIRLYAALAKEAAPQILGRQALRSGTSIGANYREAHRARSKAEFASKASECLREADETLYWLELLCEEGLVPPARMQPLLAEANELVAIFAAIVKKTRQTP